MFHQMYMSECFNLDDTVYPQETTYEIVETTDKDVSLILSLEGKQDFFDLVKSENRNLIIDSITVTEETKEIFQNDDNGGKFGE